MMKKILALVVVMLLVTGCSGNDAAPTGSSADAGGSSVSAPADAPAGPFDAETVRGQLKATTSVLMMAVNGLGRGFVEVENPTSYNLALSCKMRLLDEGETLIVEQEQALQHVPANGKTVFYVADYNEVDDPPKAASVEYEFTSIAEMAEHDCALAVVEINDSLDDQKRIVAEIKNITDDNRVGTLSYIYLTDCDGQFSDWKLGVLPKYIDPGTTKIEDPVRGENPAESYRSYYFCEDITRRG